jgi:hypothetical protein
MKIRAQSLAIVTLALIGFALSPKAEAVSPPPDGGYPGGNTAEGQDALLNLTTGTFNTAVGLFSLRSNTLGQFNTAVGAGTLLFNVGDPNGFGAIENTAVGAGALLSNFLGSENTATGAFALLSNDMGIGNTAIGHRALLSNTNGDGNTAVGNITMRSNTTGTANTAVGEGALDFNTEGFFNTALGSGALATSTVGDENTAVGSEALLFNTEGDDNTAIGFEALYSNTTGSYNTAIGSRALDQNTAGNGNIVIGTFAGTNITTADAVICIGNELDGADVSNTTWIGNVYGVTTQSGTTAQVIVSDTGQLGTVASSERFKKDISTMDRASEAILSLRPVTFHYKRDTKRAPQFGLIAEEVAKVNPALVLPDQQGKPYTVRYDAVNVMLLNEFLKEHRKVDELKSAMAQQRTDFETALAQQCRATEAVVARLNEQEARIQKVSAEVEMRKSTSQMLVENQ